MHLEGAVESMENERLKDQLESERTRSAEVRERHSSEARRLDAALVAAQHAQSQKLVETKSAALDAIWNSSSWRATVPLRRTSASFPQRARRLRRITGVLRSVKMRNSWQRRTNMRQIAASPLFDRQWYVQQYQDVRLAGGDPAEHYLRFGWTEGRNPGPLFDGGWYLDQNPDVREAGVNPLLHYLRYGLKEGRKIRSPPEAAASGTSKAKPESVGQTLLERRTAASTAWSWRLRPIYLIFALRQAFRNPSTSMLLLLKGRAIALLRKGRLSQLTLVDAIRRSAYFDREWYLANNPDVAKAGIDPALHYFLRGAAESREPSRWFSGHQYLLNNPDVAASGTNPLLHYVQFGEKEGRSFDLRSVQSVDRAISRGKFSILYISGESHTPGNSYRVTRFVEAARMNGIDAAWVPVEDLADRIQDVGSYDILVIWRAQWNNAIESAIGAARSAGTRVVFDVDDLMIDPGYAKTTIIDGIRTQFLQERLVKEHYGRVRRTMLAADVCFTPTEELAFHTRRSGRITYVLPNGFDQTTHNVSRNAARHWRRARDRLIRIGYAGGSRTHQRDFGLVAEAAARILREDAACRLVLFRGPGGQLPCVDVAEFPCFSGLEDRIEWRPVQPLADLPRELARFDINLAPVEYGNPFCEAKSELKFFEAALVEVPTVASPTGPFRRAIDHGETGFLAASADDWYIYVKRLVEDPPLRAKLAHAAYYSALAKFGPRQRMLRYGCVIDQLQGGARASRGFAFDTYLSSRGHSPPRVYPSDIVFEREGEGDAEVSVIIPLYDYQGYIVEALDSVARQTLREIDLIVVDDYSTDNSLEIAIEWATKHADRFRRVQVLKNQANYGLGFCRNSGFDAADTPYVLPLDADNRLLPECCEKLLAAIKLDGAAYVYPTIKHFGTSSAQMSDRPFDAQRFVEGNFVDAMALVSKEAWAMVGGYDHVRYGWEDYDFWCRLAEIGVAGDWHPEILAEYRVHPQSMLRTQTMADHNFRGLLANFEARHPWVSLVDRHARRRLPCPSSRLLEKNRRTRLDELLPILRCPLTRQKLSYDERRAALVSVDGVRHWPIVEGRPILWPDLGEPERKPHDHISNELPEEALAIIRETKGLVLNLSAGGSLEKFDHVVEVEYALFRHTDLVADAHDLPFDDEVFSAVIVMNAFEHYREPQKVSTELLRVLKPGGRIHVRTAFLQPLHEAPWHFYNATRYGLEEWFKGFRTDKLHVSDNFCPNYSIAWLASEAEGALRAGVSAESAEAFRSATLGSLVEAWRDPSKRQGPVWTDFQRIPQPAQDVIAAGFEFLGSKPLNRPEGRSR